MTDYRFDDDGTFQDRWAGFDVNMMGDATMSDDRSVVDINASSLIGTYNAPDELTYGDREVSALTSWDREASPNTRTPQPLPDGLMAIDRERRTREPHSPSQRGVKAFWRKASQALLSWGWW